MEKFFDVVGPYLVQGKEMVMNIVVTNPVISLIAILMVLLFMYIVKSFRYDTLKYELKKQDELILNMVNVHQEKMNENDDKILSLENQIENLEADVALLNTKLAGEQNANYKVLTRALSDANNFPAENNKVGVLVINEDLVNIDPNLGDSKNAITVETNSKPKPQRVSDDSVIEIAEDSEHAFRRGN